MKKVCWLWCLFVLTCGISGVAAEELTASAPVSFPNKFGVAGLQTLIGTDTLGDSAFSFGLVGDFSEFCLPEDPRTPQLFELGLHAGISVKGRFELGLLMPYRLLDVSDKPTAEGFDESGPGDILATAKFRFVDEQDALPAMGVYTQISFPSGDEEKGLGSGSVDATIGATITKHLGPVNVYGNVGFLWSQWDTGDPNPLFDNYQNSLLYGAGIEFPASNNRFRLFTEVTFVHEFGDDADDRVVTFLGEEIDDVVDDAGQISVGATLNLVRGLSLTGGAAFQILGEEPVLDGPVWRGFFHLAYVFGREPALEEAPVPEPIIELQPVLQPSQETPNQCPEIEDISLSDSVIRGGEQVRLAIRAVDPDGDKLFYIWDAPQGELTGREAQVVWTAPECHDLSPSSSTYDIMVDVSDRECTVSQTISIAVNCGQIEPVSQVDAVVLFPIGSVRLTNIAKAQLDKVADIFKQFPDQAIMIDGHTDATGSEIINEKVGLQRAESVQIYLVERHGIDPERMTTYSYGSTRPAGDNATEEGRAQNRRVEVYRVN